MVTNENLISKQFEQCNIVANSLYHSQTTVPTATANNVNKTTHWNTRNCVLTNECSRRMAKATHMKFSLTVWTIQYFGKQLVPHTHDWANFSKQISVNKHPSTGIHEYGQKKTKMVLTEISQTQHETHQIEKNVSQNMKMEKQNSVKKSLLLEVVLLQLCVHFHPAAFFHLWFLLQSCFHFQTPFYLLWFLLWFWNKDASIISKWKQRWK